MAQKGKTQPQDPYAQQGKALASEVKRLQGWVGSDPSRVPELANALVAIGGHRLLGHAYAAAAADAQEAVRRSAEVLGAKGPIGPYTSADDAVRYVTAVIQLAAVQIGMGVPEGAGRTLEALQDLRAQLREFRIDIALSPQTALWALCSSGRVALAAGELARANSYADAALRLLVEARLRDDQDAGYLELDVDRLLADARWAAGRTEESLAELHSAQAWYDNHAGERLAEPGRLSPALIERLAEPLFGLYRDLADRLAAQGDTDLSLVTRRTLVDRLRALANRLGDRGKTQLGLALADLADDLVRLDRVDEADHVSTEAEQVIKPLGAGTTALMVAAVRGRVLIKQERASDAVFLLRKAIPNKIGDNPTAALAVALESLVVAHRACSDEPAAESTERDLATVLDKLALIGPERPTDRARGVVSRGERLDAWPALTDDEQYVVAGLGVVAEDATALEEQRQRETAAWLEAERAEAHRIETERLAQAQAGADQREAARLAAEAAAAQAAAAEQARRQDELRLETERRAAAEEAERAETKRRREERIEEHRLEMLRRQEEEGSTEQAEAERVATEQAEVARAEAARAEQARPAQSDQVPASPAPPPAASAPEPRSADSPELVRAEQAWQEARLRGDRKALRATSEQAADLLRPHAERDLATYGPRLLRALEDLSSARRRSGDLWGSRAPAKEAKTLAKALGR